MNSKIKLPNSKELGFNIRKELWKTKPKTFKDWQNSHQKLFVSNLKTYLTKNGTLNPQNMRQMYQVMFYYSFIAFRQEYALKLKLESLGFEVKISNLTFDAIFKVDLIAKNSKNIYFIQLKQNQKLLLEDERKQINHIANNQNAIPLLVWKVGKNWKSINTITGKETIF